MGLYDDIVIEGLKLKTCKEVTSFLKANDASLPRGFQTKDLDNCMAVYKIDATGQIFEKIAVPTGRQVPNVYPLSGLVDHRSFIERMYYKIANWKLDKQFAADACKTMAELKWVFKKSAMTNTFNMYCYEDIGGRMLDLEYAMVAVAGKITKCTLIKWDIEDVTVAMKRVQDNDAWHAKFDAELQQRRTFKAQWYYPFIREVVNPVIFLARKGVQAACNSIQRATYRWHGF